MTDYFVIRGADDYSAFLQLPEVTKALSAFAEIKEIRRGQFESTTNYWFTICAIDADHNGSFALVEPHSGRVNALTIASTSTEREYVLDLLTKVANQLCWTLFDDETNLVLWSP